MKWREKEMAVMKGKIWLKWGGGCVDVWGRAEGLRVQETSRDN